ncbi:unnamed protein product [Closterium sp. Yama58-4]|nr:unnamed protein product [Closterium sp. Yama58-4]
MRGIAFKDMDPADAKWLNLELQQVLLPRVSPDAQPIEIEVHRGSIPDSASRGRSSSGEAVHFAGTEEVLPDGAVAVDIQWPDVEELWSYDAHPEYGIRPASHASLVLVQAWNGVEGIDIEVADDDQDQQARALPEVLPTSASGVTPSTSMVGEGVNVEPAATGAARGGWREQW